MLNSHMQLGLYKHFVILSHRLITVSLFYSDELSPASTE